MTWQTLVCFHHSNLWIPSPHLFGDLEHTTAMPRMDGLLMGTSDLAHASTMSQEGPGCHHCHLVWKVLQPGDNFMCNHCGVNGSDDDQGTTNQNIDASEEPPPSMQPPSSNSQLPSRHVQDIFQQIAAGNSKPRSQSVVVARSEALETFSGTGKAAQYQKLARGPTLVLGKVWTSSPQVSPSLLHGTQAWCHSGTRNWQLTIPVISASFYRRLIRACIPC